MAKNKQALRSQPKVRTSYAGILPYMYGSGYKNYDPNLKSIKSDKSSTDWDYEGKGAAAMLASPLYQDIVNAGFGLKNKGTNQTKAQKVMAVRLHELGIERLEDIGVVNGPNNKPIYFNRNTGQKLPTKIKGTNSGDGMQEIYLTLGKDGRVIPQNKWQNTSDEGKIMQGLALAGGLALGGWGLYSMLGSGAGGLAGAAGGLAEGAAGAGAAAAGATGATGLASLPMAGTWLNTALPAMGAAAGEWTLPAALSGISGATTAAGGLTLADALSSGNAVGDLLGTFGTSSGAPSGAASAAWDTYNKGGSWLDQLFNSSSTPTSNPLSGSGTSQQTQGTAGGGNSMVNLLAALYGAMDNSATDRTESLAQQMLKIGDPFGDQRQKYEGLLAQSYDNPAGTYDQYRAQDETFFNQMAAQNAARGRSTDAYKMGVERESAFNKWLTDYRTQLGGFAGAQFDPSRMAGEYFNSMNTANLINDYNNKELVGTLGNIFGGGSQQSGGGLGSLATGAKDLYNTGKSIWDWGSSALGNLFG